MDRALILQDGAHSHPWRREVAQEATRGSFDEAVDAVERATGQKVGKRQAVELACSAAVDIEAFYAQDRPEMAVAGRVLVLRHVRADRALPSFGRCQLSLIALPAPTDLVLERFRPLDLA